MKKILLLVGLLSLCFVVPTFAGKPQPPEELTKIFTEVIEIEDAIEEQDWQKSLQTMNEVDELFEKIASSFRSVIGDDAYEKLTGASTELRRSLNNKDEKTVLNALLAMQKQIFLAMDYYDYPVHTSFSVVKQYVAEAIEAGEKAQFDRVVHEMKEVANVVSGSAKVMTEKGVGKGMRQDFLDQLFKAMNAASAKDQQATMTALKKMETLAGAFVWMGQQQ